MQGRLSPPGPRAQTFPWVSWEREFDRARVLGFDAIEWLFDAPDFERNPIWTEAGVERIVARIRQTGVAVSSVCANYFMGHPFFRVAEVEAARSAEVLSQLIARARAVGAGKIVVPVLEQAEIRRPEEQEQLLQLLRAPLQAARSQGIVLALETELPAGDWLALMDQARHPDLGVYYDTGNATAKGYDAEAELRVLRAHLRGVHIKDRARGGPNVLLGTGGVNFGRVFAVLVEIGYNGTLVLETTVGDDYYANAQRHLEFVHTHLQRAEAGAPTAAAPATHS